MIEPWQQAPSVCLPAGWQCGEGRLRPAGDDPSRRCWQLSFPPSCTWARYQPIGSLRRRLARSPVVVQRKKGLIGGLSDLCAAFQIREFETTDQGPPLPDQGLAHPSAGTAATASAAQAPHRKRAWRQSRFLNDPGMW